MQHQRSNSWKAEPSEAGAPFFRASSFGQSRPSSSSSGLDDLANPYPIIQPAASDASRDSFSSSYASSSSSSTLPMRRQSTSEFAALRTNPITESNASYSLPITRSAEALGAITDRKTTSRQRNPTRRQAHIESEKKRRGDINQGFDQIRALVPGCTTADSKTTVLGKTVDHITSLQELTTALGYDVAALPTAEDIRSLPNSRTSSNRASVSSYTSDEPVPDLRMRMDDAEEPAQGQYQQERDGVRSRSSIAYLLNTPTWNTYHRPQG